ncbi:excisionase homolog protein [Phocaeicola plebeius CAG:211]|uniref:Excisionase homolog protein n=1 Tax=Phocaeicola plebeius CAG:211 TaxID=1263052 RepID=R5VJT8_9BACT|nr:hypothetical protein [Phocaeicola plebeius]CCZ88049.1 excisionase homolog protein [Phocaeicola plebeius CAG:211]
MKKIFLIIISTTLLYSCSEKTNEEKVRESIEKYLKESMNDWDSYEFVDMGYVDSLFNVNGEKISNINFKTNYRLDSVDCAISIEHYSEAGDKEQVEIYKNRLDSLIRTKNEKEFIGWETNFTFRGNNKLGAKVINTIKVQLNKNFFIDNVESSE